VADSVQTQVVGCFFAKGRWNSAACTACLALQVNDGLILEREPHNPVDSNAVLMRNITGTFVGYARREQAPIIADWMDRGLVVAGKVTAPVNKGAWARHRSMWPWALVWCEEPEAEEAEAATSMPRVMEKT
jgi:hypothetical protein